MGVWGSDLLDSVAMLTHPFEKVSLNAMEHGQCDLRLRRSPPLAARPPDPINLRLGRPIGTPTPRKPQREPARGQETHTTRKAGDSSLAKGRVEESSMSDTAKVHLRTMYALLIARYTEYDINQFSEEYWRITDEHERAKAAYLGAKNGE